MRAIVRHRWASTRRAPGTMPQPPPLSYLTRPLTSSPYRPSLPRTTGTLWRDHFRAPSAHLAPVQEADRGRELRQWLLQQPPPPPLLASRPTFPLFLANRAATRLLRQQRLSLRPERRVVTTLSSSNSSIWWLPLLLAHCRPFTLAWNLFLRVHCSSSNSNQQLQVVLAVARHQQRRRPHSMRHSAISTFREVVLQAETAPWWWWVTSRWASTSIAAKPRATTRHCTTVHCISSSIISSNSNISSSSTTTPRKSRHPIIEVLVRMPLQWLSVAWPAPTTAVANAATRSTRATLQTRPRRATLPKSSQLSLVKVCRTHSYLPLAPTFLIRSDQHSQPAYYHLSC